MTPSTAATLEVLQAIDLHFQVDGFAERRAHAYAVVLQGASASPQGMPHSRCDAPAGCARQGTLRPSCRCVALTTRDRSPASRPTRARRTTPAASR